MHLALKREATKPAACNFLQQARFDDFIDEYNNERPHQALDMKFPAEFYVCLIVDMSSILIKNAGMGKVGRPVTSKVTRGEQLRSAKRAQRERERRAGLVNVQLVLPGRTAAKLAVARRAADFPDLLDDALDQLIVHLPDYPQLRDLAWNHTDEYIPAKEAFQLYERNWRFIEPGRLDPKERALIDRLKASFGGGVINA